MANPLATGLVPGEILEGNRPGDWQAVLLLADAAGAREVALTGAHAALFTARLEPALGRVTVTPAMVLDREAFPAGTDPLLSFGLSVRLPEGWRDTGQSWTVQLRGIDDTPPQSIAFVAGGAVLESDIGAEIGTLQAQDPDSAAGLLSYSIPWPDSAWFEMVGRTLKLRDGVDLLREGGTTRTVMVEVSDGRQSAAFGVAFRILNVTDEDDRPAPPPVVIPPPPPPPPPVVVPPVPPPPMVVPPVPPPPVAPMPEPPPPPPPVAVPPLPVVPPEPPPPAPPPPPVIVPLPPPVVVPPEPPPPAARTESRAAPRPAAAPPPAVSLKICEPTL